MPQVHLKRLYLSKLTFDDDQFVIKLNISRQDLDESGISASTLLDLINKELTATFEPTGQLEMSFDSPTDDADPANNDSADPGPRPDFLINNDTAIIHVADRSLLGIGETVGKSFCHDRICKDNKIKKPFVISGRAFVCVERDIDQYASVAIEIIPEDQHDGITRYGAVALDAAPTDLTNLEVKFGRKKYVLGRAYVLSAALAEDEKTEDSESLPAEQIENPPDIGRQSGEENGDGKAGSADSTDDLPKDDRASAAV